MGVAEIVRRNRAEELEASLTELAAHLHAGTCHWLELVAEFDDIEGWGGPGVNSCAEWLTWRCGIAPVTAREQVRVARKLRELPLLTDAFRDGQLSYSQTRALTRCATADNQSFLLDLARNSTAAQLESITRNYKRYEKLREAYDAPKRYAQRAVNVHYDEEGFLVIEARLLPEDGQVVLKALEAAEKWTDDVSAEAQSETEACSSLPQDDFEIEDVSAEAPPRRTFAARKADALVALAEAALEHGTPDGDERSQVIVHVDEATLDGDDGEVCELEDGTPLARATVERLMCDSYCSYLKTRDGRSMSVSYKTRRIPTRLRRALRTRDPECRWPGCHRKARMDGHHVEHVTRHGETRLENLVHLCKHHHWAVHEGGFDVRVTNDGGFEFLRRDGEVIHPNPPPPRGHEEMVRQMNAPKGIDAHTCESRWGGEECDSVYIADLIIEQNVRTGHLEPFPDGASP